MPIKLTNAICFDLDAMTVEPGEIVVEGGRIVTQSTTTAAEIIDCGGAIVMPGMVNGHTHLYSALATGMPPPVHSPRNFLEILQQIWWKLDQALDARSILHSAQAGAMQAALCGTTTLIDHHASPNCIDGSLDLIEQGITNVGLRGVLCYETTDRHGKVGRDAGLQENRRYLSKCAENRGHRFSGMVGGHASFTLDDDSLEALVSISREFGAGVHIHVAEDPCDEQACRDQHQIALMDRLERHGLLSPGNLLAHCIHLDDRAIARINESGVAIAHNPRSNMNNAVGYAKVDQLRRPVVLGTDGIGGDLFAEAQHAWFKARDARSRLTPDSVLAMLRNSARKASDLLGVKLGSLQPGSAADLIVTDYSPLTPLTSQNIAGHTLFAMGAHQVRHVMVDGQWVVRDRHLLNRDSLPAASEFQQTTSQLWRRMSEIG